jgi:PAS domain S-box-containing protein
MNKRSKHTESNAARPAALCGKADGIARKKDGLTPEIQEGLTPGEIMQLIQDLRVHQIKLQMQSEELRSKQAELDILRGCYFDLYDMAPVGYCMVTEKGLIRKTNFSAARQLGVARSALIQRPISWFILNKDQDIYHQHQKRHSETGQPQSCKLRMIKNDGTSFRVHLVITSGRDADGTPVDLVVMTDIAEPKRSGKERGDAEYDHGAAIRGNDGDPAGDSALSLHGL